MKRSGIHRLLRILSSVEDSTFTTIADGSEIVGSHIKLTLDSNL